MHKRTFLFILIIAIAIGAVLFIRKSNDHTECSNRTQSVKDSYGNVTVLKEHVCKEKFSL